MLGESVVLGGGGGGTRHALARPRSADNLARLTSASSLPALDDLAESEVFVGDEDEEFGMCMDVRSSEELRAALLDPEPSHAPTSLTYHEDGLRLPLDAVKEEVEAEALEEASMILSSGPASLGPLSLSSSLVSAASLEDLTTSSRTTDTLDTVLVAPSPGHSPTPSPAPEDRESSGKGASPARPAHRDASRVSGAQASPTSPRSSGQSSPHSSVHSPSTPERRRRSESSRGSTPGATTPRASVSRSSPRTTTTTTTDKSKPDERKVGRTSSRGGSTSLERRPCVRLQDVAHRRDHQRTTTTATVASTPTRTKAAETDEGGKMGTLGRKKKTTDTKDLKPEADSKSSTLGRRKKEVRSEKEEVAEKYGTLGRRRKTKEAGDTRDGDLPMSRDTKHTLDMYATLPRRKAREMSARWREQQAQAAEEEAAARPSLRRTRSVGKSESSSSSGVSKVVRGSTMTSSLPPSALSGLGGRPRSPRTHKDSKSISTSTSVTRKERTIICLEVAIQTSLTGGDVSSALKALSRQNSLGADVDEGEEPCPRPHVPIVRETPDPEDLPDRRDVEVQVDLVWWRGEGEHLPEHVRRLTEEHTRLQTEHARARARLEEVELEVNRARAALDDERGEKEEVQGELDRTSQRVKDMLVSMEGVEHEFNSRGDSLMELESQLHHSADIRLQLQDKLIKYEEYTLKMKKDLEKSLASQKMLLQQVQDLENEGQETVDFMAAERNAVAECLREAEAEIMRVRNECSQLSVKMKEKEEEARHLVQMAEENRNKWLLVQGELSAMQCRTRDMMVCQGAAVSGAAVALTNLSSRLHTLTSKLIQDYTITDADLEMIVTPSESDSSASSANGTPEHKAPAKAAPRTPSPRKTASFIMALLSAMRVGNKCRGTEGMPACNGSNQLIEGRNSPEGSESQEVVEAGKSGDSCGPSLSDQVTDVDALLTRLLKVVCVLKNDADNRLTELEDENDHLCTQIQSQQRLLDQQESDYENLSLSKARVNRELMAKSQQLETANQKLNKLFDQESDHEEQIMKLQEELEREGRTVRHLEALNTEKERQLEEVLASLQAAQASAPPNHISESAHLAEVATLNDKVASLRQSVIEQHQRVNELNQEHVKDKGAQRDLQHQLQRSNTCLHNTLDLTLKTLESIPDVVASCPSLKQLFTTLANQQQQQQQQQNGNTENGIITNDLNANPQSVIETSVNNKKILTSLTAETHL